jgi:hypothetical protein
MDTAKMRELIAELEVDIKLRQEALQGLRKLLSVSIDLKPADQMNMQDSARPILFGATDSYVDLAVKVITANDSKPMRMNEIVARIRVLKGNPDIQRRSVESTLIQHARAKTEQSRIVKVRRGVWGIRRFPRESLTA